METLNKDILNEILFQTTDRDLIHLCQVDKKFRTLCNDEFFWKKRGIHFYPDTFLPLQTLSKKTFQETYKLAYALSTLLEFFSERDIFSLLHKTIVELYRLTYISLEDSELESIPKEIGSLENLVRLDLSENKIHTLPLEIGKLYNLENLYLSNNLLKSLPHTIGSLGRLRSLFANNIQLTSLPKEIGQLQNLETLYIDHNELKSLPKEIGQLKNLRYLYIDHNNLTSLPKEMANLKNLMTLVLANNPIPDKDIAFLTKSLPDAYIYENRYEAWVESKEF